MYTERSAPAREYTAQEWTTRSGARQMVVREMGCEPLTDQQKANLEDWGREQRRKLA